MRRFLALLHRLHPWHMLLPLSNLSSFYFSTSYIARIFFFHSSSFCNNASPKASWGPELKFTNVKVFKGH